MQRLLQGDVGSGKTVVALSALLQVVAGTTTGMLLADVPVVFLGAALAAKLPLKPIRFAAAGLFVVLGVLTLVFGRSVAL